ncbi:MAG: glycosyl transferase [Candidatus Cellulosilyticum pullistercoris]|uniref:Glycosyl transferase n=1 Tax=Candidatus Cellulosilyticum pullistercoris TaxID=2838521 RepID=A0A9E2NLJ7_9FIRM|nr:glycosyl transferase [Candidatus Cellulosilyticum pullistercoris]
MLKNVLARETLNEATKVLNQCFKEYMNKDLVYDSQFMDVSSTHIIAIGGFVFKVPALKELFKDQELSMYFSQLSSTASHLFCIEENKVNYFYYMNGVVTEKSVDLSIQKRIMAICEDYKRWAGYINEKGEHVIDLKKPVPGPHFYTNMLLGDRMNFDLALQSTPKSVVDRLGGGSFRAHAANQVLATRWDMLPEENGFPANRQFYIVEEGKQIFYSADVLDANIERAECRHGQNYTEIEYETKCGLKILRTIFLVPQYEGLPIATEVQRITLINKTAKDRDLKVVTTGMLATAAPGALMEDVVYSTVIMQSQLIKDEEEHLIGYVPYYYPEPASRDVRYTTMVAYEKNVKKYPTEICTHYGEFIGSGNLYKPQGILKLSNRLNTKGPGFFALGCPIHVEAGETTYVDHFIGLISELKETRVPNEVIHTQLLNLHRQFESPESVVRSLNEQLESYKKYSTYLQVHTGDTAFDSYVNKNLPFQVLYQTFVSRSFDLTQKGYREIGFREIQDIFVSQYYLISMGEIEYTKSLLREWIEKVFDYGYCYHNFFWQGKEPGKWSDDGLWLLQAVYRYVSYSGDFSFLDEVYEIAGTDGKTRSVYETLKAIITYSAERSIGEHGLPLIDFADWNDCLKVDAHYVSGPEKERQDKPLKGYSESVMNAFLLKLALQHMKEFSSIHKDQDYEQHTKDLIKQLDDNIQKHAWKENFFARVLFNRFGEEITFLGAKNDGFSADPNVDGTYFLNSFSWSILSSCANEKQIGKMLDQIEQYLKTPYGLKLMSPTDLSKVAKGTATGEYFPGDRENGGIFKHATMMATAAMLQAAKRVEDKALASRLTHLAYWMVGLVLPYKALENPFEVCGNPRWCTQYNNSLTGENIGPTLSGTSTWLAITLFEMLGIKYEKDLLVIEPLLDEEMTQVSYTLRHFTSKYVIEIHKPIGLSRMKDQNCSIIVDGKQVSDHKISLVDDGRVHQITLTFGA